MGKIYKQQRPASFYDLTKDSGKTGKRHQLLRFLGIFRHFFYYALLLLCCMSNTTVFAIPNLPKLPHFSSNSIISNSTKTLAWVLISEQTYPAEEAEKNVLLLQKLKFAAYTQQKSKFPNQYQLIIGPDLVKKALLIEQRSLAKQGFKTKLQSYHLVLKQQLTQGFSS